MRIYARFRNPLARMMKVPRLEVGARPALAVQAGKGSEFGRCRPHGLGTRAARYGPRVLRHRRGQTCGPGRTTRGETPPPMPLRAPQDHAVVAVRLGFTDAAVLRATSELLTGIGSLRLPSGYRPLGKSIRLAAGRARPLRHRRDDDSKAIAEWTRMFQCTHDGNNPASYSPRPSPGSCASASSLTSPLTASSESNQCFVGLAPKDRLAVGL